MRISNSQWGASIEGAEVERMVERTRKMIDNSKTQKEQKNQCAWRDRLFGNKKTAGWSECGDS